MKPYHRFLYGKSIYRQVCGIILLFIGIPMLRLIETFPIPLMLVLMFVGLAIFLYLWFDPAFDRSTLINWEKGRRELRSILVMFIPVAIAMVALIWIIDKEKLFLLAGTNPLLLLMISIFYPVFSVVPQGLIYRGLLFHRYVDIFPGRVSRIIASAALFSFGHILYKNWLVLLLTFIAGLVFAWRYEKSKSLFISILEHALYGVWLFTCGLGYFFVSSFVE